MMSDGSKTLSETRTCKLVMTDSAAVGARRIQCAAAGTLD